MLLHEKGDLFDTGNGTVTCAGCTNVWPTSKTVTDDAGYGSFALPVPITDLVCTCGRRLVGIGRLGEPTLPDVGADRVEIEGTST
ncbi:hypothetical protein AB0J43_01310 [Nonomuraea fuscirosea]